MTDPSATSPEPAVPATVTIAGADLLMLLAAAGVLLRWIDEADERDPSTDGQALLDTMEVGGLIRRVSSGAADAEDDLYLTEELVGAYAFARTVLGLDKVAAAVAATSAPAPELAP